MSLEDFIHKVVYNISWWTYPIRRCVHPISELRTVLEELLHSGFVNVNSKKTYDIQNKLVFPIIDISNEVQLHDVPFVKKCRSEIYHDSWIISKLEIEKYSFDNNSNLVELTPLQLVSLLPNEFCDDNIELLVKILLEHGADEKDVPGELEQYMTDYVKPFPTPSEENIVMNKLLKSVNKHELFEYIIFCNETEDYVIESIFDDFYKLNDYTAILSKVFDNL
uniref:Uncharacterized protein n=1 Tax=viral metagenome TaxID=1070528 RepID=A0A6C0E5F4_9ZZZZ